MSGSNNSSTGILAIIAIVLVAIFGVMIYQVNQDSPAEQVADSISDAADDIGDAAQGR